MKAAYFAIFALALAAPAFGQIIRNRSCLTLPITPGFSVSSVSEIKFNFFYKFLSNFPSTHRL